MITNQDPATGIRYTLYACHSIDSETLQELLYTHGKDLSYEEAVAEEIARQKAEWEQTCEDLSVAAQDHCLPAPVFDDFEAYLDDFDPVIEEPIREGEHQGVHYRTTWLGGAQLLWVFKSPITGHFALCSPCVPGACDGDTPTSREDGYMGYALPPDWLVVDESASEFRSHLGGDA